MKINIREENFLPHQWQFMNATARTLGLVGGLGSGKSIALLFKAFISLISRPGPNGKANVGIGYPTYDMGKSIFFYPFCELLEDCQIPFKINLSDLSIATAYGRIVIKSLQYPERIIGETFTDAGLDEIDTIPMPKGMHSVRRFRERLRGRVDAQLFMVSSPESFSTCYETLKNNPNPDTLLIHGKTTDNKFLSQSYIDDIIASYDPNMIEAYINGQFVNLNNSQAHYAFDRARHVRPVAFPELGTAIQVGIDFNVNPLCSCLGYWKGDTLYMIDEYYLQNSNTYMLTDLLKEDWKDWMLDTYPDPTGTARKTSSDISDIEILTRAGWNVKYKHGITQRRSLNMTNGELSHDRIIIDPKCKKLINDLEQVVTDDHGDILKPNGTKLTHMSDALRNIIVSNKLKEKKWGII